MDKRLYTTEKKKLYTFGPATCHHGPWGQTLDMSSPSHINKAMSNLNPFCLQLFFFTNSMQLLFKYVSEIFVVKDVQQLETKPSQGMTKNSQVNPLDCPSIPCKRPFFCGPLQL